MSEPDLTEEIIIRGVMEILGSRQITRAQASELAEILALYCGDPDDITDVQLAIGFLIPEEDEDHRFREEAEKLLFRYFLDHFATLEEKLEIGIAHGESLLLHLRDPGEDVDLDALPEGPPGITD